MALFAGGDQLYLLQKFTGVDGFGEQLEIMAAPPGFFEQVGSSGLTGEEQHAAVLRGFADLNGEIDAGEAGHDNVADEQVGRLGASGLESFQRIREGGGLKAASAKDCSKRHGYDRFVIHDENAELSAFLCHRMLFLYRRSSTIGCSRRGSWRRPHEV